LHDETLKKIRSFHFQGTILVEKPLFSSFQSADRLLPHNVYVAYNLRFHALFYHLRNLLVADALISFSVQTGSYLPDWRKNRDYRAGYSAQKKLGGGVLRDLSHELDYILWFCGKCVEVTAIGGHLSALEIDSDDIYSILMRCENCAVVNIQLDYLNRTPTRKITIHTKKQNTIILDLIKGDLVVNGELQFQVNEPIAQTYIKQHALMIEKKFTDFCDYNQGLRVVALMEAIEKAALEKKWIVL